MDPQLYPHQISGVNFLSSRRRALLADEQGLGKTATAICAAKAVGARRVLVVCPTVVVANWMQEFRTWGSHSSVQRVTKGMDTKLVGDVVIIPHSLIAKPTLTNALRRTKWDVVIVDEAHAFRTPTAQRTRAMFGHGSIPGLFYDVPHVWYLTGTPLMNNPSDLWTLVRECNPLGIWLPTLDRPMNHREFLTTFCTTRPNPFAQGQLIVTGVKNADRLKAILAEFTLRRMKQDHLDLPPKIWEQVALESAISPTAPAVDITDLDALRADATFAEYRRACGSLKASLAVEYLKQELESEPKIVVAAWHRDALDILGLGLEEAKIPYRRIDGSTPTMDRGIAVHEFQHASPKVMLCQIQAAGVGITLTAARRVVFVEQSWLPGDNAQMADRCHRIGQTGVVVSTVLTLRGTADAEVGAALMRRTAMIAALQ